MRHARFALCLAGTLGLAACQQPTGAEVDKALDDVNVIDATNLNDIMLTVADPEEAVQYFTRASAKKPDRIDLKRGLAKSLVRAKRPSDAAKVWAMVATSAEATNEDKVAYADALIRDGQWDEAAKVLEGVPPTYETYDRYRLEAMVADWRKQWKKADSFYETAAGLTTRPAGIYNNWGYSKLSRGDYAGAEKLFRRALEHDRNMFTAKNNLVLARGAQHNYSLPNIPMTQIERAKLLYTLGLAAVKQGDIETGKTLMREAIDTHPQYFEAAVRSLETLEGGRGRG